MPAPRISLTAARLKALVHYDPETGIFTSIVYRNGLKVGQRLGWIQGKGYRYLSIDGVSYKCNRLAWLYQTGVWPPDQVDHEDRDRANDKWGNLRLATNTQNTRNCKLRHDNASGHKGIYWHKRMNMWQAQIRVDKRLIHLGSFMEIEPAIAVRKVAELKYFGEFAAT